MNRGTIRDEICSLNQDTDRSNPRWSDAVLNARIDLAHDEIASLTHCVPERKTVNSLANTGEYVLGDDVLQVNNVLYKNDNGDYYPLVKMTEEELDEEDLLWRSRSGTPKYWYQRINYVGLVPYPEKAVTAAMLQDCAVLPVAFSTDADIPWDAVKELYSFHVAIAYRVAMACAIDNGTQAKYALMSMEYDKYIKMIRSQVDNKGTNTRMPNVYDSTRKPNRRSK